MYQKFLGLDRYIYLEGKIGTIEICRQAMVETVVFQLPDEAAFLLNTLSGKHERQRVLKQMQANSSSRQRLVDFMQSARYLENMMLHRDWLSKCWLNSPTSWLYFALNCYTTVAGIGVNVLMIESYSAARNESGDLNMTSVEIDSWAKEIIDQLGVSLAISSTLAFVLYWVSRVRVRHSFCIG